MKVWIVALCSLLASLVCLADSYTNLCVQAAELSQRQDYQGAIAKYEQALAIRPGAPEASNNLAVMLYQVGRYSDALQITGKLWRSHPELHSAALIAGMSAVQCNRASDAIEPLQHVLQRDGNNRDALLALASAFYALNQLQQAADVYRRELQVYPKDTTAWYGAAICYERLAEDSSRALAHMPGGLPYSKRLLAEYLQSLGDSRLAAEAFGDSEAKETESPEAAEEYEQAQEFANQSRTAFEQFVSLSPDSWQAALFLGDVDRQHGDLRSAVLHYKKAAEAQPSNPAPLLGLGTAYWELGDFEEARMNLNRTLQLKPGSAQALFELANIDVRQHRDAEAIPLLKNYLALQPDAVAARADLGRAYFHLKQFADAARELELAAAGDTSGEIHYQLSVSLKNLGRTAEAEAALKKSIAIKHEQLQRSERLHAVP
jgi:tetratricopeptide (TPR) repeat protein